MRHAFRTERDLLDERPRVRSKRTGEGKREEEEEEDEIPTITCQEVQGQRRTEGTKEHVDPNVSLITDFQIITDLRVSPYC